jgi:hypothetical protein
MKSVTGYGETKAQARKDARSKLPYKRDILDHYSSLSIGKYVATEGGFTLEIKYALNRDKEKSEVPRRGSGPGISYSSELARHGRQFL